MAQVNSVTYGYGGPNAFGLDEVSIESVAGLEHHVRLVFFPPAAARSSTFFRSAIETNLVRSSALFTVTFVSLQSGPTYLTPTRSFVL